MYKSRAGARASMAPRLSHPTPILLQGQTYTVIIYQNPGPFVIDSADLHCSFVMLKLDKPHALTHGIVRISWLGEDRVRSMID